MSTKVTHYQNMTDRGLATKRGIWSKKYSEASAKVGQATNNTFRAYWAQKMEEASAELDAIRTVYQIRAHC